MQMKSDELMSQMSEALKSNTHVRELVLVNCNVGLKGCEFLAEAVSGTHMKKTNFFSEDLYTHMMMPRV
jgi:hypothetical protein